MKQGWYKSGWKSGGMTVPLGPLQHNSPEDPLPSNEQLTSPAVTPAVAGRAPATSSGSVNLHKPLANPHLVLLSHELLGVRRVELNRRQQKVTVTGNVDPHKVLRRAQSTGKKAEVWPQYPSSYSAAAVAHYGGPGAAQAHDRWAPACYPRNTEAIGAEHITSLFSDDNPNACSIM